MALTEVADGVGTAGRVAERYVYSPYGEFVVLKGQTASGMMGNALPTSSVGNLFMHQGLPFDAEKGSYQNRHRDLGLPINRYQQPDPDGYRDGLNLYVYARCQPNAKCDPTGLGLWCWCKCLIRCWDCKEAMQCVMDAGNYCSSSDRVQECADKCPQGDPFCESDCVIKWHPGSGKEWSNCMKQHTSNCSDLTRCADCLSCIIECLYGSVANPV
jgi:RHS repeat-associated protein